MLKVVSLMWCIKGLTIKNLRSTLHKETRKTHHKISSWAGLVGLYISHSSKLEESKREMEKPWDWDVPLTNIREGWPDPTSDLK